MAPALVKRYGKGTDSDATDALITHALTSEGHDASEDGTGRGTSLVTAFHQTQDPITGDGLTPALGVTSGGMGVRNGSGVRRLTPRECERLQALPDDWTAHGPDSRRYAALGDAVTSSVAEWIGRRIISGAAEGDA